ncbi:mechanosensitive ion channel family protein [Halostella litorea]|uniref:mechanosensitive ion channel family protein n=1 Tax=Halostella litorea TaxID=2528831 RepID=UPI00109283BC|nr:mechanosensitive ion channel family protein [Halostella litorea]
MWIGRTAVTAVGQSTVSEWLSATRRTWSSAVTAVPDPVVALVILAVGWYVSQLVVRLVGRSVARRFRRPSVTRTVLRGVRFVVLLAAAALAGIQVGLRAGDVLISVTVLSAVIGITLAPIASSIISGLFVLADQPYEIGDMIELADRGQRGYVEDITLRYTKMVTLDNTFLVIPNSTIRERDIVNHSAEDERTRLSLSVQVTYESDVEAARTLMERAARDVDSVVGGGPSIRIGAARYPAAPTCYVDDYADDGVVLTLRYWAKQPYKLLTVRSAVNERLRAAFAGTDDVTIAYPHQHLVFDETSGTASVNVDGGPGGVGAGDDRA